MANNLVIIESPFKAAAIKSYLGSGYKVVASNGHIRDLPKSSFGIDIENNFEPHYINIRGRADIINEIKKDAKNAQKVYFATDPDREGEAISWHLATALGIPVEKTMRVTFNSITKNAVKDGIKNPRSIDMNIVNAQQSRRLLDRIVGYKLSPLLWKKIRHGLSAGRVQSVATRIIVEREEEIRAFRPVEYWTITALLSDGKTSFTVKFFGNGEGKVELHSEAAAARVTEDVKNGRFVVKSVKRGTKLKTPAPPFITSTLQQEASRKLGFQASRTMKTAQELYEGINLGSELGGTQGLITYMRTDSQRVAEEAQSAARELIASKYGSEYCPETPRNYKTNKSAQDAHEAIRPARVELEPADVRTHLTPDQYKLYRLIWERFVSSQMESARLATLSVELENRGWIFRTGGYTVTFPGYMAVYEESSDDGKRGDGDEEDKDPRIPELAEGQLLSTGDVSAQQHFTEAPPRYNDATLVKFLEEKGIGRPSTFATIISTIISRGYVTREGKALIPTQLGEITTALMKESFADIVDYRFTANIENELDSVERGETTMQAVLSSFWDGFSVELNAAEEKLKNEKLAVEPELTDIVCEKCGATMVVRNGRFGKFAACPNYPNCKNTKALNPDGTLKVEQAEKPEPVPGMVCELCGGPMVLRRGRYGSFYACANYPKCKFNKRIEHELEGISCPKCGGRVLIKYGKNKSVFYSCANYPNCDFSTWDVPLHGKCPQCGGMLFRKKGRTGEIVCHNEGCNYRHIADLDTADAGHIEGQENDSTTAVAVGASTGKSRTTRGTKAAAASATATGSTKTGAKTGSRTAQSTGAAKRTKDRTVFEPEDALPPEEYELPELPEGFEEDRPPMPGDDDAPF